MTALTLKIDEKTKTALREQAQREDRPTSYVVRRILRDAVRTAK